MINKLSVSIRFKLLFLIVAMFLVYAISMLSFNHFFLDDYYVKEIEEEIRDYISQYDLSKIKIDENALALIKKMNRESGYKFIISDKEGNALLISTPEFYLGQTTILPEGHKNFIINHAKDLKKSQSAYVILKTDFDSQVMFLEGLGNGYYLNVTEQLSEVQGNADIANRFFVYVTATFILAVIVITFILSKRWVKPIVELSQQAEAISDFDFSIRTTNMNQDEIGILSNRMNTIAIELEKKIDELNDANEQLSEEMSLQKQFLASVSHEFKSPIGIIQGFSETLKMNLYKDEEERNQYIDYIISEANQLSSLIEDVILLARLGQKNFKLSIENIDFSSIIYDIIEKYQNRVEDTNRLLIVDIQEEIYAQMDKKRMHQVVRNLMENALYYTIPEGNIKISLKKNENGIMLQIANDSELIDDETLGNLIQPFYRLEKSQNQETGGQGLGLAISDGIVKQHGGQLLLNYEQHQFVVTVILSEAVLID